MTRSWLIVFFAAFSLVGCTALDQFPQQVAQEIEGAERTNSYATTLKQLDPDYAAALEAIKKNSSNPEEQKRIRNEEIDRRLAVIDANFTKFKKKLAQESVKVDFGVSLLGVGVGGAGALGAETASQILSAVSGGLAGAQAAYGKAALYDKALSALLQQMIAGRNTILAEIYKGRTRGIDEYPLSAAAHDLDAYYFAGSLPGAIVGTSADAQVKNAEAEIQIAKALSGEFVKDTAGDKVRKFWKPDGTNIDSGNAARIKKWMVDNNVDSLSITFFMRSDLFADARAQAVKDLGL